MVEIDGFVKDPSQNHQFRPKSTDGPWDELISKLRHPRDIKNVGYLVIMYIKRSTSAILKILSFRRDMVSRLRLKVWSGCPIVFPSVAGIGISKEN